MKREGISYCHVRAVATHKQRQPDAFGRGTGHFAKGVDEKMQGFTEDQIQRAREMNNEGARYYQQGKYKDAIKAFTRAITLCPQSEWAFYFNRGRARDDSGDLVGAIADYMHPVQLIHL